MSDAPERHDTVQVPSQSGAGKRSVLVVDDDVALARALQRTLERAGFEVVVAEDGTQAVQTIMSRAFDVVVTDIQMPGMSGLELLGIVRAYDLDVPVILMTGDPTVQTAMAAALFSSRQYHPEPWSSEVMVKPMEWTSKLHLIANRKG